MVTRIRTTRNEILEALRQAATEPDAPTAKEVRYLSEPQLLLLVMENGRRFAIPREDIQGIATAPMAKVLRVELEDFGSAVHWPLLDLDLSVEGLLKGITGNQRWMQQLRWKKAQANAATAGRVKRFA